MHCPVCGFENLTGADICDNCGADLAGHDIPQPAPSFHGRLLGEHLDELGRAAAADVAPDDAGRRGHRAGCTTPRPTACWSWPTTGWSASSPTATRS